MIIGRLHYLRSTTYWFWDHNGIMATPDRKKKGSKIGRDFNLFMEVGGVGEKGWYHCHPLIERRLGGQMAQRDPLLFGGKKNPCLRTYILYVLPQPTTHSSQTSDRAPVQKFC